eukprot:Filipodium_phascolosomae@DN6733_c0_g1_i1.p1
MNDQIAISFEQPFDQGTSLGCEDDGKTNFQDRVLPQLLYWLRSHTVLVFLQLISIALSMASLILSAILVSSLNTLHISPRRPYILVFLAQMKAPPLLYTTVTVFIWDLFEYVMLVSSKMNVLASYSSGIEEGDPRAKTKSVRNALVWFFSRLIVKGVALALFLYFASECLDEITSRVDFFSFDQDALKGTSQL